MSALAADGTISFTFTPTSAVDNFGGSFLTLDLSYTLSGEPDFYSFDLLADQAASLVVTGLGAGTSTLELLDADGTSLALGQGGWNNVNDSIANFIAPADGTYYARVRGDGDYSLVVTRGASFYTESTSGKTFDLGPTNIVLSHGSTYHSLILNDAPAGYWRLGEATGSATASDESGNAIDGNYVNVSLGATGPIVHEVDTAVRFPGGGTNSFVEIPDDARLHNERAMTVSGWFRSDSFDKTWQTIYWKGDTPDCGVNCQNRENTLWLNNSGYLHFNSTNAGGTAQITLNTASGIIKPGQWYHFATVLDADAGTMQIYIDGNQVASGPYSTTGIKDTAGPWRLGTNPTSISTLNGIVDEFAIFDYALDTDQVERHFAGAQATRAVTDYYFEADENARLVVTTKTPGDGVGQPVNAFDPRLELYNQLGFRVASDDDGNGDHNALLTYTVPEGNGGRFQLRVLGQQSGDYVVRVEGGNPELGPAPEVLSAVPDGAVFASPPTAVELSFSEPLLLSSVDASDLVIDQGATVSGVEVVNASTIRFLVDVPDVEALYTYVLAADVVSDLQGLGNLPSAGNFLVDKTGPRVVDQLPELQASAPFTELTFTFDELLNGETFTADDIRAFTGPGGVSLLGAVSAVVVDGAQATVSFAAQSARGTYTMVLGPNIEDVAGNPMDQDNDGLPGEEDDDVYVATVDLESPDLDVVSVTVPATGVFGQTLTVSWVVQNLGTDPALEDWSDRVYLSTDTSFDNNDIPLGTFAADLAEPLGPGESYSKTVDVTLPLELDLIPGNYFIVVRADALSEQPESNEANNVAVSEVLPITLPPLPDLVVSAIDAPAFAISNQEIEVSWTLTNQGDGQASGVWKDYVFLSTDDQAGGDQFYGAFEFIGTINAGESITRTQRLQLPRVISGEHWVVVHTDAENKLFEHARDDNNVTVSDQPIDITVSPFPNLQVTSITPPETAFSSQQTLIEWVVTNTGDASTSAASWYDRVYLSRDEILDGSDTYLGRVANASYLAAGESYVNQLTPTLPRGISGEYYFFVQTDYTNAVFENENEDDNISIAGPVNIQLTPPPDLQVASVNAPLTAFSGQSMNLSWTVANEGEGRTAETAWWDSIYMSDDDALGGDDRYLGRVRARARLMPERATRLARKLLCLSALPEISSLLSRRTRATKSSSTFLKPTTKASIRFPRRSI